MIKIGEAQFEAFVKDEPERLKGEFARRLRLKYPDRVQDMGEDGLRSVVDDGFVDADTLEIEMGEDVYRLIELRFLPHFQFENPFNQSAMIRILNNTALPGTQRLDMIYKQVVPRDPPAGAADPTPRPPD